jgi:hypothetical protein
MMRNKFFLATVLVVGLLNDALSQWNFNTTINTAVVTATNSQRNISISSDTKGGAILVWEDRRNSNVSGEFDVYAQRINSDGYTKWLANGIAVCTDTNVQNSISSVEDGSGGVIITWDDYRNGNADIYAQKIDSNGVIQWAANGIPVCNKPFSQKGTKLISDGLGGAIIVWQDSIGGLLDIYAQRINNSGIAIWASGGVPVCNSPGKQIRPRIQPDKAGGAFIVWQDRRNGLDYDIYAQRMNSLGNPVWATNGIAVCTANYTQSYPKLRTDGAGGIIVVWQDKRTNIDNDIYAQRISATGVAKWQTNGVSVCSAFDNQEEADMTNENVTNGVIVTWTDHRSLISHNSDIFIQKIDTLGVAQWQLDGIALTSSNYDQKNSNVVGDGKGGAIVIWQDSVPTSGWDVNSQKVNSNGIIQWQLNGIPVGNANYSQTSPGSISDGANGCIYAWEDNRNGFDNDIYVQHTAIATNTTTTVTAINQVPFNKPSFKLSPNPFSYSTVLTLQNNQSFNFENAVLKFTNITGKEVMLPYSSTAEGYIISRGSFPSGVYFYTLFSEDNYFAGKLVITN